MATGQAKTKAEELINRLNALVNQRHPSEFQVLQLQHQAESLRQSSFVEAAIALGAVATIRWDESEMRRQFDHAMQMRKGDHNLHANFARCLVRLNLHSEARRQYEQALQIQPSDKGVLADAIKACTWSGQFLRAKEYIERFNRLSADNPSEFGQFVAQAIELLKGTEVSEQQIDELVEIAMSVLRDAKISYISVNGRVLNDEESGFISIEFLLDSTISRVVDFDDTLAEKLAVSSPSGDLTNLISITFGAARPDEYYTA